MGELGQQRTEAPLVGSKIRELRLRFGWTQTELAQRSGVPGPTISKYETNKRRQAGKRTLRKLANVLGVPVEEFTGTTQGQNSATKAFQTKLEQAIAELRRLTESIQELTISIQQLERRIPRR
jgi:transcriptional regulator with XRE-family HTH domain